MSSRTALVRLLVGIMLTLPLGGCLAPTQSLRVEIREALGAEAEGAAQPGAGAGVPGVGVKVTTLNPQHVLRPSDYTRWLAGGPEEDQAPARTGADGTRIVEAPTDRPFMLNLLLPGAIPESVPFRETGVDGGPFASTGWIALPVGVSPARFWLRVAPAEPGLAGR